MSIGKELDQIKKAIYGKEVRQAIHDGIKKTYIDATEKGNTNMEVALARGDYHSLNDRLDGIESSSFLNVKKFGAKGDGINDDTIPIQEALDYIENAGGGIVYIPPGLYNLKDALYIGSNVNLIGEGRSTVLDATEELNQGTALLYTKYRGGNETYDGASNFSIENLAITSSTRKRQGLYFDNAVNFKVSNIWGLGKCKDHYIDLNNSKNGLFENIHLVYDPQGTSPFQIDSKEGFNDGITIRDLYIMNNDYNFTTNSNLISSAYSAIHFHNFGGRNIDISNVIIEGMNVGVFKDDRVTLENIKISDVKVTNSILPVNFENNATAKNKNITLRNWNIKSDKLSRGFGEFTNIENLTIEDITINTNIVTNDPSIVLNNCNQVKVGGVEFQGNYKGIEEGLPLSFIESKDSLYSLTRPISGTWVPKLGGANTIGNVEYTRQQGWYEIAGNAVKLTARLTVTSISSARGPAVIINLPVKFIEDSRESGTVGIAGRIGIDNLIVVGGNITVQGGIRAALRLTQAATENYLSIEDLENGFFTFSIQYIFGKD